MSPTELLQRAMEVRGMVSEAIHVHPRVRQYYVANNELLRIRKVMAMKGERICPACDGWGKQSVRVQPEIRRGCSVCNGTGVNVNDWRGYYYETCAACHGRKEIVVQESKSEIVECGVCHGERTVGTSSTELRSGSLIRHVGEQEMEL